MNLIQCKNYVREFLNKNYQGKGVKEQLGLFKTYNFVKAGIQEGVHEDSTTLAKAVYFIIWHNHKDNEYSLPLLTDWQKMEEVYGGESINTFNSLFQESLNGAKLYISEQEDSEFYEKAKEFQTLYLTIGNFMLLPKGKVDGRTLNTKKGSYNFKYKDYCDLFLFDLFETSVLDEFKEANKEYFTELSKTEFFKRNFLNDYCKNNRVSIIFEHDYDGGRYYPLYWWKYKNPKEHSEEYRKFALNYIEEASRIIKHRAEIMTDILYFRINNQ